MKEILKKIADELEMRKAKAKIRKEFLKAYKNGEL